MLEILFLMWLSSAARKRGRSGAWALLAVAIAFGSGLLLSALFDTAGFFVGYLGGYVGAAFMIHGLKPMGEAAVAPLPVRGFTPAAASAAAHEPKTLRPAR
jgi:hypothetical protein